MNAIEMLDSITRNPDLTLLEAGRADGITIIRRDITSSGTSTIEAWEPDGPHWRSTYTASVEQRFGSLMSSDGVWGVNITGSGPWNSVEAARLAAQVITLAANLAAERNAADIVSVAVAIKEG